MGTQIEWTDETWSPVTGCTRVSTGCQRCYAERLAGTRLRNQDKYAGLTRISGGRPKWTGEVRLHESELTKPLGWRKPRRVFVCSMSDLFHEKVPEDFIDRVFAVMALCYWHTFQILTKRPERMAAYFAEGNWNKVCHWAGELWWEKHGPVLISRKDAFVEDTCTKIAQVLTDDEARYIPLRNVWAGTSVENQKAADERIPHLLKCPAAVRFLSVEPMLGPVDLTEIPHEFVPALPSSRLHPYTQILERGQIHWVICGGESGPGARPMHPDWARSLRDQCQAAGVPFFFKQWGEWAPCDWQGLGCCPQCGLEHGRVFPELGPTEPIIRVGKKAAGRLLDGREWNEMPEGADA